ARQSTFNPCLMRLPNELPGSVTLKMLRFFGLMVIFCVLLRTLARFPWQMLWVRALSLIATRPRVERLPTGRRSTSMTFEQLKLNFLVPRPAESQWAFARYSPHRYSVKGLPLAPFISAGERFARFPSGRSRS